MLLLLRSFENDLPLIGMTCIYNTYIRMRPLVTKAVVISQGSDNPNSPWAQEQFGWFKQLSIRYGKLDPTKFRDPSLPQMASGGNPVTKEFVRFEVETSLNELVDNVVINCHTTLKHDTITNDITEILNQMVDQVVSNCLVKNYVASTAEKLLKDVEERCHNLDLDSTDSEFVPSSSDSDESSISTCPDEEEGSDTSMEDVVRSNVGDKDDADVARTSKDEDVPSRDVARTSEDRDLASGDVARSNIARGDLEVTDTEKKCLFDKVPPHVTTLGLALEHYITHATRRWEEEGKITTTPQPITEAEKIAFRLHKQKMQETKNNSVSSTSLPNCDSSAKKC